MNYRVYNSGWRVDLCEFSKESSNVLISEIYSEILGGGWKRGEQLVFCEERLQDRIRCVWAVGGEYEQVICRCRLGLVVARVHVSQQLIMGLFVLRLFPETVQTAGVGLDVARIKMSR